SRISLGLLPGSARLGPQAPESGGMIPQPWGSWRGPLWAALLAGAAAAPGLGIPFLADDWALLGMPGNGWTAGTPFGYFRPLSMATLSLDRLFWGVSPAGFHLTNLVL